MFTGVIPSQIGQLKGACVFLKDNVLHTNTTAPLSLCVLVGVEKFDLADNATFCPPERNALSDFYDSAKGTAWTPHRTDWMDEYASHCGWKGVTCDDNHVIELNLTNNGLSGRLSESIGKLIFVTLLDLSDNDIKVSAQFITSLPLFTFLDNSHHLVLTLKSAHRDPFRLSSASCPNSHICVSATTPSQERHQKA